MFFVLLWKIFRLEREGLLIEHIAKWVTCILVAFCYDKLGANYIASHFSSALRICRFCMATTQTSKSVCDVRQCQLKTKETHHGVHGFFHVICIMFMHITWKKFVNTNKTSQFTGTSANPHWINSVLSMPLSTCHDIMNDLLDGIGPYEINLVINAAVTLRRVGLTCVQRVVKFWHTPNTVDARFSYVWRTLYTFGERSKTSWHVLTR